MHPLFVNAQILSAEMDWLAAVIRFRVEGPTEDGPQDFEDIEPPEMPQVNSAYSYLILRNELDAVERLVLALAAAPYIRPSVLDPLFLRNPMTDRGRTEHGGISIPSHPGFYPTGETALYLIAGEDDLSLRFRVSLLFYPNSSFSLNHILYLKPVPPDEPWLNGQLMLHRDFLTEITTHVSISPQFSSDFPAKLLETNMDWEDLVLNAKVREQIEEIRAWIEHGEKVMLEWNMEKRLRPGYRCLFYGPPGTGKTLTASLLGKSTGRPVYRIDLSLIVSKYIGETEKNLGRIFDLAENKDWILFFDEADSLFGKRTAQKDSHDRYANQETSFLLQRVESFNGICILASNLRGNMDPAFLRRFENMIYFPMPQEDERFTLWQSSFSLSTPLDTAVDLQQIASKYEMSGGAIMNVVRYATLMAARRDQPQILLRDLETGIRKEFEKEGKAT